MNNRRNVGIDGLKIAGESESREDIALPRRKIGLPTTRKEEKIYKKTSVIPTRRNNSHISDMKLDTLSTNAKPLVAEPAEADEISKTLSDIYSEDQDIREKPRKKQKRKAKRSKRKKTVLIIVLVLVFLVSAVGGALFLIGNDFISRVTGGGNLLDFIVDPGEPLKKDEQGLTNVLVYGTEGYDMDNPEWDGGQLTDSIMVLSLNQETGVSFLTSLPRDLKAQKRCTATGKLNEVYWCTYSKNDGTEASREDYEKQAGASFIEVAEEITGLDIHYYVHVNWSALVGVVDALGGVEVAIAQNEGDYEGELPVIVTNDKRGIFDKENYDPDCGKTCYMVDYKNGDTPLLDGKRALALARTRNALGGYGASRGNFDREINQQKIITAIVNKAKETNFVTDIGAAFGLLDTIGDGVRMSFKDTELKTLFRLAKDMDMSKINSVKLVDYENNVYMLKTGSLPLGNCVGESCQTASYVFPSAGTYNYAEIHKYIAEKIDEVLNPPVVEDECSVEDSESGGASGATGSEKAEDTATKC